MLELIKKKIKSDFLIRTIRNTHCKVSFNEVKDDKLIFDFDKFYKKSPRSIRRCDFAIFLVDSVRQRNVCLLMELKGGSFRASTVSAQLKSGADLMNIFLWDVDVDFIPLVLSGRANKEQIRRLKKERVVFKEVAYSIVLGRCGDKFNLHDAIYSR